MSDYRRANYSREDPRLSRQNSATSPKQNANIKSPSNGQPPENWNAQTATYNHSQALQNAYQSLSYQNPSGHQYPTQTYYTGYQNYSYNPYENYQAAQQAYMTTGAEPHPPGEDYSHGTWPTTNNYSSTSEPPPPPPSSQEYTGAPPNNDKKKNDAVAEEKIKQLASLMKEREIYDERVSSLSKKLKLLVEQRDSLSTKRSPDKDTMRIIKENTKLQLEIQSKIKDANNVIEILSNLIGDKKKPPKADESRAEKKKDDAEANGDKMNLKHFDPMSHWCRMCDVFPHSAKELLLHLHSKSHQETAQEEIPWHKLPPEPKFPTFEGAPVKRVPIKGLQFFVAATAWYCRLCDTWIGDLHCASQHLMSITHSQNYTNFVEQNPHWEMEWMLDREKALDRVKKNKGNESDSEETKHRKRKEKYSPSSTMGKEKKKKKRSKRRKRRSSDDSSSSSSSSSSSDDEKEDRSKSIRVAMRNKQAESDTKLDLIEKFVRQGGKDEVRDDKLMSQWMSVATPPNNKDKQILDNLKEKLKQKQDAEKAKLVFEAEVVRRQREREEMERRDKERIAQELAMKEEEEKKHREKMSLKLKEVKMKSESSQRRRSPSRSPDRRRRRSRSPSSGRRSHRNGRSHERSPSSRYERDRRSRSRDRMRRSRSRSRDHSDDESKRDRNHQRDRKSSMNKRLPFIGRMPLFKNMKPKGKNDDDAPRREIQKEDYEPPRKTRFQPGNLARAFIPQPDVVCFPQLSSYPPIAPPPPPITPIKVQPPEAPKITAPKPPPAPKIEKVEPQKLDSKAERALKEAARELEQDDEEDEKEEAPEEGTAEAPTDETQSVDPTKTEEYMLYEDTSNNLYQYGAMDYNMIYPPAPPTAYNYMAADSTEAEPEPPKTHTMPLEPPPLPPDDPNEDLAMLGLSSDDMAVQQMY